MKTILAGILVLAVFASADKPCEVPERLAGDFNLFVYNIDEDRVTAAIAGTMYYDKAHRRFRLDSRNAGTEYQVIQLFEERIQYDITSGRCKVVPVTGKFLDMSISANASLQNSGRIGTPSDDLNVDLYLEITPEGKFATTVTQKECVPTSTVGVARNTGVNYIIYISLTNTSLDYDDDVFNPPGDCERIENGGGRRARRATGGILDSLKDVIEI